MPPVKEEDAAALEELTCLSSNRFGGSILFATDEWFATADNLLSPVDPIWIDDKFTDCGKWMDGWETRRKRSLKGCTHDWCLIQLGLPGRIELIEVDTAYFTGNQAPRVSIQGAVHPTLPPSSSSSPLQKTLGTLGTCATQEEIESLSACLKPSEWSDLVPFSPLAPGYPHSRKQVFQVTTPASSPGMTHLRLNLYPDGGIARVRAYGTVTRDWCEDTTLQASPVDLAAATNGGRVIAYSDKHYGAPRNLIGPGRGVNMGDGWETARKPDRPARLSVNAAGLLVLPGSDFVILKLATSGRLTSLEIDTAHFKGNYPESCRVEGLYVADPPTDWTSKEVVWQEVLSRTALSADQQHFFANEDLVSGDRIVNYLRLTIMPDGGISRLRAHGIPCSAIKTTA